MRYITDMHLHSKYSRATSPEMNLESMYYWSQVKGIDIVGTGDCIHPKWLQELEEKLEEKESGLYALKSGYQKDLKTVKRKKKNDPRFLITTEISSIYKKNDKARRVHTCIVSPSIQDAKKLSKKLGEIGNIVSDGRPILGLGAKELLQICLDISEDFLVIPAHIWTPWFALFGSKSGFDTIEECYDELTPCIYAVETGLSSDPIMNWRVENLDNVLLVSNSDAHSPRKLAREATVFDMDPEKVSFHEILRILKEKDLKKIPYTIEFYPEEGKYHYDGHRDCKISMRPEETKKQREICPECGKKLTVGVMHRVEDLAGYEEGRKHKNSIPYKSIVPLEDIISDVLGRGPNTKTVQTVYEEMTQNYDSEFNILLDYDLAQLRGKIDEGVLEGIQKMRTGDIYIKPGYDGVFGEVKIFSPEEKKRNELKQKGLFGKL